MKASAEEIEKIKPGFVLQEGPPLLTVAYVYNKTKNYIIYEVKETGQITYKTAENFPDNTYSIALKLDKVETYLDSDRLLWSKYRNTMADIYYLCLEENKDTKLAEQMLDQIIPELELSIFGYSKIYYLIPCVITVAFFVLTCLFCRSYNYYITEYPKMHVVDEQILFVLYIVTFAALGGLFSVAINIDKHQEKISSRVKWGIHSFTGVFRILIAMLSGLTLYVLLNSKIIEIGFQKTSKGDYGHFIYYALAIVAGFSQTFIPNLMRKVEDTVDKPDTTTTATATATTTAITTTNTTNTDTTGTTNTDNP
ncbi:MAG TPA: hypothetical protein VNZ49_15270 [Bacteroidia bacterium]|jgi:hypothetical protein|nr:hypothetical protein [Bacteroidia bacterium]